MATNPGRRPTLKDVARLARVSHMTVSRFLTGSAGVKKDTERRIRAAIEKTSYRPDPALSALAAYRQTIKPSPGSTLAFLDCDGSVYSQSVLNGVRDEASLLGYEVENFSLLGLSPARQLRLANILFNRGTRGVLLGPSDEPHTFAGWNWDHFATVSLGALSHSPAMHSVAIDYFQGAIIACQALHEQGRRRIGFFVEQRLQHRTGERWVGGYMAWVRTQKQPAFVLDSVPRPRQLREWIRSHRIDGLLTIHSEAWSLRHTEKIQVAFLNDYSSLPEALHLVSHPVTVGREGVRLLHHLLLRREFGIPALPKMVALCPTLSRPPQS